MVTAASVLQEEPAPAVKMCQGGHVCLGGWWLWMEADGMTTATAATVTMGESPAQSFGADLNRAASTVKLAV